VLQGEDGNPRLLQRQGGRAPPSPVHAHSQLQPFRLELQAPGRTSGRPEAGLLAA
jgi:hypothetical protein